MRQKLQKYLHYLLFDWNLWKLRANQSDFLMLQYLHEVHLQIHEPEQHESERRLDTIINMFKIHVYICTSLNESEVQMMHTLLSVIQCKFTAQRIGCQKNWTQIHPKNRFSLFKLNPFYLFYYSDQTDFFKTRRN